MSMDDMKAVHVRATGGETSIGEHVPRDHLRHVHAVKYTPVSGAGTSGVTITLHDKWGTSNHVIDQQVLHNMSGQVTWPPNPRPDFAIGHVKESGVASVSVSGAVVDTVIVFTDMPGGRL